MDATEEEIWEFLHRHLTSIFTKDPDSYQQTTTPELSLYEWFVTPHRQDGLDFHLFMIEQNWSGADGSYRYDLLEPRLQRYGDAAIVSYTFMLSIVRDNGILHRTHNESRVLIRGEVGWQVVHVHKSPAWSAPFSPA